MPLSSYWTVTVISQIIIITLIITIIILSLKEISHIKIIIAFIRDIGQLEIGLISKVTFVLSFEIFCRLNSSRFSDTKRIGGTSDQIWSKTRDKFEKMSTLIDYLNLTVENWTDLLSFLLLKAKCLSSL